MQIIQETPFSHPLSDNILEALSHVHPFARYETTKICFFDIETTGLSADVSSLYLIGCAYPDTTGLQLKQWFANDYVSEKDMLLHFLTFLKRFELLVHYNGGTFDLPYVRSKCEYYDIDPSPLSIEQFDLYAYLRPYKKTLSLSSLKQTAVEAFLGVDRKDALDGGALIHVYSDYMKHKYFRSPKMELDLYLLLLHNKDDVLGMVRMLPLVHFLQRLTDPFTIESVRLDGDELLLKGTHPSPLDFPVSISTHSKARKTTIRITPSRVLTFTVPVILGEMKHFYPNYKDYYYLPLEDAVIHKSVAAYVDPRYREKVSKRNCFVSKTGRYVPAYNNHGFLEFHQAYGDKSPYIELTNDLLEDVPFWTDYAGRILDSIVAR